MAAFMQQIPYHRPCTTNGPTDPSSQNPSPSLTNRDELSFRRVLALPKASRAGLAWMIWSSRVPWMGWDNGVCGHHWGTLSAKST